MGMELWDQALLKECQGHKDETQCLLTRVSLTLNVVSSSSCWGSALWQLGAWPCLYLRRLMEPLELVFLQSRGNKVKHWANPKEPSSLITNSINGGTHLLSILPPSIHPSVCTPIHASVNLSPVYLICMMEGSMGLTPWGAC